jgi:hypothetical protein
MKNMKIKIIMVMLTILMSGISNAGFFDFDFFGNSPSPESTSEQKVITEHNFIANVQPMLMNETVIKDSEYLKDHYEEISLILRSFSSLERNLNGYEEKKVVTNLKNFFKDKYLLTQADLIQIKKNLNEVIK